MKLFGMAALAVALAAAIAIGGSGRESTAQEETPELGDVFVINASVCIALATSDDCQAIQGPDFLAPVLQATFIPAVLDVNANGTVTREEVDTFNRSGNHLHQKDGVFAVIVFVDDDEPLVFDTDDGRWQVTQSTTAGFYVCDQQPGPSSDPFADARRDEDCDGDGERGDGIVVAQLTAGNAALGDSMFTVYESQTGKVIGDFFFEVVGEPDALGGAGFETVLGAGLHPDDCPLPTTVPAFTEALGNPHKTVVIARIKDSEGTDIIGGWVHWEVDDADLAKVGAPDTPTLDLGSFGIGAPQVICALDSPGGTVTLEMSIVGGPVGGSLTFDPNAEFEEMELEFEILPEPATMTLTSTPAAVNCDGVASAEVAATVTSADGEFVANGTIVHWDVQVLGIAAPLESTVTDGIAKTIVTPLGVTDTGVPVIASTARGADRIPDPEPDGIDNDGDDAIDEAGEVNRRIDNPDIIQSSILVTCGAGSGAPPPPPPGTGTGTTPPPTGGARPGSGMIGGPDTGSGGDLDGQAALPVWPAIALFAGAMALVGARWGLRSVR